MNKWIGKVAVVTGASSGIGKEIVCRLAKHGVKVVACARNADRIRQYRDELIVNNQAIRGKVIPYHCDIRDENQIRGMFEFVKTNHSDLGILINNAGIAKNGSIIHGNSDDWLQMYKTNVHGLCVCTQEAFKQMEAQHKQDPIRFSGGYIININSIYSYKVWKLDFSHFYVATKFAIRALTEGIRQEVRKTGINIRVGQISPGYVKTEMIQRSLGEAGIREFEKKYKDPLIPEDISAVVEFYLSQPHRISVEEVLIQPMESKA